MSANLSIELLRSFVAVVEKGSILRATERIYLTQSALSLQIRRLEDIVQRPLFRREANRRLVITPAGTELLGHAREILAANDRAIRALSRTDVEEPIRLALPPDFAEIVLPDILKAFARRYPQARLLIRTGGAPVAEERLDIAITASQQPDPKALAQVPVRWIGDPSLVAQETLPLALLPEPCAFRASALQALERAGRKHRIAVEATNLAGLKAAVKAGLGITPRPLAFLTLGAEIVSHPALPALPDVHYALHHNAAKGSAAADLAAQLRAALTGAPKGASRKTARSA